MRTFSQLIEREADRLCRCHDLSAVPREFVTGWLRDNSSQWGDELDYDECSFLEYFEARGLYVPPEDEFAGLCKEDAEGPDPEIRGFLEYRRAGLWL